MLYTSKKRCYNSILYKKTFPAKGAIQVSEEMRTFGYLCPVCGKPVMASRSVFALESSNAEVECDCGESALRVEFDGTRYRVYVPCGICGESHVAACMPEQLTEGPGIGLACAKTKQFC